MSNEMNDLLRTMHRLRDQTNATIAMLERGDTIHYANKYSHPEYDVIIGDFAIKDLCAPESAVAKAHRLLKEQQCQCNKPKP